MMVVEDFHAVEERSGEADQVEISQVDHYTKENDPIQSGSIYDEGRVDSVKSAENGLEAASGKDDHEVVQLLEEKQVQPQDIIGENGDTSIESEADSVDRSSSVPVAGMSQGGDLLIEDSDVSNAVEEVFERNGASPALAKDEVSSIETGVLDEGAQQSDGGASPEVIHDTFHDETEGQVLHATGESQSIAQVDEDQNEHLIEVEENSVLIPEEVNNIQEESLSPVINKGMVDDSVSTTNVGEHCEETAPSIVETSEQNGTHENAKSLPDLKQNGETVHLAKDENETLHEGTHEDARSQLEDEIADVALKMSANEQGAESTVEDQRAQMAENQIGIVEENKPQESDSIEISAEEGSEEGGEGIERDALRSEDKVDHAVDDVTKEAVTTKDAAGGESVTSEMIAPYEGEKVESLEASRDAVEEQTPVDESDSIVQTAEEPDGVTTAAASEGNNAEVSKEVPLSVAATDSENVEMEATNNSVFAAQVEQSTEEVVVNGDGSLERQQHNVEATTTSEESKPTERNKFEEAGETDGVKSSEGEPSKGTVVEEVALVPLEDVGFHTTQATEVDTVENLEQQSREHIIDNALENEGEVKDELVTFEEPSAVDAVPSALSAEKSEEAEVHKSPMPQVEAVEHKADRLLEDEDKSNDPASNCDVPSMTVTIEESNIADAGTQAELIEALKDAELHTSEKDTVENLEEHSNVNGALEVDEEVNGAASNHLPSEFSVKVKDMDDAEAPTSAVDNTKNAELHTAPATEVQTVENSEEQNSEHKVDRGLEIGEKANDAASDHSIPTEASVNAEEQNLAAESRSSIVEDLKAAELHTALATDVETPEKIEEQHFQHKVEDEANNMGRDIDVPSEVSATDEPNFADGEARVDEAFKDAVVTHVEQHYEHKVGRTSEIDEEAKGDSVIVEDPSTAAADAPTNIFEDSKSVDLLSEPAADLESVKNLEKLSNEHADDRALKDGDEDTAIAHEVPETTKEPDSEVPVSIDDDFKGEMLHMRQDVETEHLEQQNTDPEVDRALDNATDEVKVAANDKESISIEETTAADGEILAVSEQLQGDVDGEAVEPEDTDAGDNVPLAVAVNVEEQNLGDAETQPSIVEDLKDENLLTVPATDVETPEFHEEQNIEHKLEDDANNAESEPDVPSEVSATTGEPVVSDEEVQVIEAFKDEEVTQVGQTNEQKLDTASEIYENSKGDSIIVEELSIADAEAPTSISENSKSVDLHGEPAADLESVKILEELNKEHTAERALEDDDERTAVGHELPDTIEEPVVAAPVSVDKDSKDGKLHISQHVETEPLEQQNTDPEALDNATDEAKDAAADQHSISIEETTADGEIAVMEQLQGITADVDARVVEPDKVEVDHLLAGEAVVIEVKSQEHDTVLQESTTGVARNLEIDRESPGGVVASSENRVNSGLDNNDEGADLTSNELDDMGTFGVAQLKDENLQETTIQVSEKGVAADNDLAEVAPVQSPNEVDRTLVNEEADDNERVSPRDTVNVEQSISGATKEQSAELQGTSADDAESAVSIRDESAVEAEIHQSLATSNNKENDAAGTLANEDESETKNQVPAKDERSSIIDAQVKREELEAPVDAPAAEAEINQNLDPVSIEDQRSEATNVEPNEVEKLPTEVAEEALRNEDHKEKKPDITVQVQSKDEASVEPEISEAKVEIEEITSEQPAKKGNETVAEVQISNSEAEVEKKAEDNSEVTDVLDELKGTVEEVFAAETEQDAPKNWDTVDVAATKKTEEVQGLQGDTEALAAAEYGGECNALEVSLKGTKTEADSTSDEAANLDESAVGNLPDYSSKASSEVPNVADRALEIEGETDSISGNDSENVGEIIAEAGDVAEVVYKDLVTECPEGSVTAEGKSTMEKAEDNNESGDVVPAALSEYEDKAPPQVVQTSSQPLPDEAAPADDKKDESTSVDSAGSKEEVAIQSGPMDSRTEEELQRIDDSKDEAPSTCSLGIVAAEEENAVEEQPEEENAGSDTAEGDGAEDEVITVTEAGDNTARVLKESELSTIGDEDVAAEESETKDGYHAGTEIIDESEEEIGIISAVVEKQVNQDLESGKAAVDGNEQDTKLAEYLLAIAAEEKVSGHEEAEKHEEVETGKTEEERETGKTGNENADKHGIRPETAETGEAAEQEKVFTTATNSIASTFKSIIAALTTKPSKKKRQRLRKELAKAQEQGQSV